MPTASEAPCLKHGSRPMGDRNGQKLHSKNRKHHCFRTASLYYVVVQAMSLILWRRQNCTCVILYAVELWPGDRLVLVCQSCRLCFGLFSLSNCRPEKPYSLPVVMVTMHITSVRLLLVRGSTNRRTS
jgi:hypothetical protein